MKKLLLYLPAIGLLLMLLGSFFPSETIIVQTAPQIANGEVVNLQPMTTIKLIVASANGATNTFRWVKDFADGSRGFIFAKWFKDIKDLFGFVMYGGNNASWTSILKWGGNAVNRDTFKYMVESLESDGWRPVLSAEIPEKIRNASAIMASAMNSLQYAQYVGSRAGTFFVSVPVTAFGQDYGIEIDN